MSNKGVCRTVPAKPGLLIILESNRTQVSSLKPDWHLLFFHGWAGGVEATEILADG